MSLFADGLHNFIDGMIIAGSYLVSPSLGIATTIAVIFHEIPQEIGDFAILIFSGFSFTKAILFNLLSATTAIVGALIVLTTGWTNPEIGNALLAFAAGNFLYIAGTDLIPELHRETRLAHAAFQLIIMVTGIVVMYGLTMLES
ncbi:MAG: ZIP family metal transporter [Candidatus Peribacteraceae bacterium]|nr:ZIP family metal transporter [Candidatus Peribacteraceae bacterium]